MKYTVAIIGLGSIGLSYDINHSDKILSHSKAFFKHPDFILTGGVDPREASRLNFTAEFNLPAYKTVESLFFKTSPNIIVVSSPTDTHLSIIEKILNIYKPLAIICEKPLSYNSIDAKKIVDICKYNSVKLYVNYYRRADPGVISVKSMLESRKIISPQKVIVWYSKGIIHNGSHFLDLLFFWLGEFSNIKMISKGRIINNNDAEPDICVSFKNCSAYFLSSKEENFSHYTVEIIAVNGRLRYETNGTIIWNDAIVNPELNSQKKLDLNAKFIDHNMDYYQQNITIQLSRALNNISNTLCKGSEALRYVECLEQVVKNNGDV